MVDTLGSKDLIKSKKKSKSKASYFDGITETAGRRTLEEPEPEYDEDFDGKFISNILPSSYISICFLRNPTTFQGPLRPYFQNIEQLKTYKEGRQIQWL